MKKPFEEVMKELRIICHPIFVQASKETPAFSNFLVQLEIERDKILTSAGYTIDEYNSLADMYFIDFSSENPDEWIIKYDPDNATIIYPSNKKE